MIFIYGIVERQACRSITGLLSLFILLAPLSCASNFNGAMVVDGEATRTFESYTILPDHKYYIHGSDTEPAGIIGIQEAYRLKETAMWRAVDATPEKMKKWLNYNNRVGVDTRRRGFNLLGPNKERIGIYYPTRTRHDRVAVNLEADGQVVVSGVIEDVGRKRSWADNVFNVE